jgi:hypothetical protein
MSTGLTPFTRRTVFTTLKRPIDLTGARGFRTGRISITGTPRTARRASEPSGKSKKRDRNNPKAGLMTGLFSCHPVEELGLAH